MDEIRIGFSRPRSFSIFSRIIRAVEKTSYSHVYLAWHSSFLDRDVVYQAKSTMVHFLGTKLFERGSETVHQFAIKVTPEGRRETIQWAMDNAGLRYGFFQVIGVGIVRIAALFGYNITNPINGEAQFCSKLAGVAIKQLGFTLALDKRLTDTEFVTLALQEILEEEEIDLSVAGPKMIYDALVKLAKSHPNVTQLS